MGIKGLLPYLKQVQERIHISEFANRKAAVDGYCILHRGISTCAEDLALKRPTQRYELTIYKVSFEFLIHYRFSVFQ
jgi:exonuclease-1